MKPEQVSLLTYQLISEQKQKAAFHFSICPCWTTERKPELNMKWNTVLKDISELFLNQKLFYNYCVIINVFKGLDSDCFGCFIKNFQTDKDFSLKETKSIKDDLFQQNSHFAHFCDSIWFSTGLKNKRQNVMYIGFGK